MSALKYWLWISQSPGLSPRVTAALIEHYGSPEAMFFAPKGEIKSLVGRYDDGIDALEKRDIDSALRILDECEAQHIRILTVQDADYPDRLKNISLPPNILYVKGKLPPIDDEAAIAIVGTRKASPHGLTMAKKLGYEIAKCGGVVVSGLTAGIDAMAAKGALYGDGTVIGVLGVPHEQAKTELSVDVMWYGALISEYPPGTPVYPSYFRARNRISAGLSMGVVVVEAPQKSGARLFANEAADQGKELFVVPGNAGEYNCMGSNAILKEGAKPVTEGWDVMCEYASLFPDRVHRSNDLYSPEKLEYHPNKERKKKPETEKVSKKEVDKEESEVYIDSMKQLQGLTDTQQQIVSAMNKPSMQVDELIERTELSAAKVLSDLTLLQLMGYVEQEAGKRFTLKIK